MLDPGTALAVAGMAMDVTKDLLDFFKSWKTCPEDALALRAAILWLSQTFFLARKTLRSHQSLRADAESTYDTIITSVESCESKINALKTEVDKVQSERGKDRWQKVKNELKRFRYFFSKETISSMMTTIRQCEDSLHVTITLLNLGTTANVLDEVRSLSSTIGNAAHVRDEYLKAEFQSLKVLLAQQATQFDIRRQLALVMKDQEHKQALEWLVSPERQRATSRFHTSLYRSREFGTGSWFTNGEVFTRWQEADNSCLWLQGPVGCGKSVLCSTIIHDLQQRCYVRAGDDYGDILMYHYFSHTEEYLQLSEPMLRSFIAQGGFHGSVKSMLIEYYARYNAAFMPEEPSLEEFTAFLSTITEVLSCLDEDDGENSNIYLPRRQIFLILDALDEVPFGKQRDDVLQFIQYIRNLRQNNLHLLVTSRSGKAEKDIGDVLECSSSASYDLLRFDANDGDVSAHSPEHAPPQLRLMKYVVTAANVKTDIELVVRKELRTHRRLKTLQPEVKELILDTLVRHGQPVFREVAIKITQLTSEELSNDTSTATVSKILLQDASNRSDNSYIMIKSVPDRLDELYRQLLDRIPPRLTTMVHNALRWLVQSRRSLTLDEFVEICAFGKDDAGSLTFFQTQRKSPQELLTIFQGLVVAQSFSLTDSLSSLGESRVSLAHFSVKEFLTREALKLNMNYSFHIDPLTAHQTIATCCVKYLLYSNFFEKRHQQYALRNYAWNYWVWHIVRTRALDNKTETIEQEMSMRAARLGYIKTSETISYLTGMLWALTGMHFSNDDADLSMRLALPYFYEELDMAAVNILYEEHLEYNHGTLRDPLKQLRLVELLPSDDNASELRASLRVVENIHEKSYEVVTYMWNSTPQPGILRINGMPYKIPTGLEQVLRRLRGRAPTKSKTLWIDAVSINMNNLEEKGFIIQRMHEIFTLSTSHAIFADTSVRESDGEALELLKQIDRIQTNNMRSDVEKRDELLSLIRTHPIERLFQTLFDRRIWTRLWVLQEMVLSRNSTVFFGDHQISTDILQRVFLHDNTFQTMLRSVRTFTEQDLANDQKWRSVVELAGLRAEFTHEGGMLPLRALYASRYLQYGDPRDRVYGILGLMRDDSKLALTFDYSVACETIFVELCNLLIKKYQNLDMLSLISHELPDSIYYKHPINLPSWISTFTWKGYDTWPLVTSNITYPVIPDVFKACADLFAVKNGTAPASGLQSEASMDELILEGWIVDKVLRIYGQVNNPTFANIAMQRLTVFSDLSLIGMCTSSLEQAETLVSAYWRTTCANQSNIGKIIPYKSKSDDQNLVPSNETDEKSWKSESDLSMALEFSQYRRFFISEYGRFGLASRGAQTGDLIAICPGGKVPYLLRPTDDERYILIGDSYVHGIMNGEAVPERYEEQMQSLRIE